MSDGETVHDIMASATSESAMDQAKAEITDILRKNHRIATGDDDDFEIRDQAEIVSMATQVTGTLTMLLSAVACVSLLVGGIGIMNIMLASILERTKEIGIMKAIGATKQDIILQFLSESILISLGGGIIGCILGIIASYILELATDIETIVSVGSILLSFLVATFIGLIFGVLPAKSAANKNPIEAIRHE